MKRTAMVCLLAALVAATLMAPADAADRDSKKVTRRVVATYDNPTLGIASGTGGAGCLPCPRFSVSETDRWVQMEVHDAMSPAPAAFGIRQERADGSCCDQVVGPFCGSTGKPVAITPGLDVFVFVFATGDVTCPGAFGTTGRAVAEFSNIP